MEMGWIEALVGQNRTGRPHYRTDNESGPAGDHWVPPHLIFQPDGYVMWWAVAVPCFWKSLGSLSWKYMLIFRNKFVGLFFIFLFFFIFCYILFIGMPLFSNEFYCAHPWSLDTLRSPSSLPRKPLAKGLFSIFNWVIYKTRLGLYVIFFQVLIMHFLVHILISLAMWLWIC